MILWTVITYHETHWCATQAQAKERMREIVKTGIAKRHDVTVQSATIPTTGRDALAAWLNDKDVRG